MKKQETETNTVLKTMFNALVNIITDSTCHGLPRVFKSNRILTKVFWSLLTLGSLGACIFTIYGLIVDYLSFDVTTKIRVIPTVTLDMPQITICNINPFLTNDSQAFVNEIIKQNGIDDPYNSTMLKQTLRATYFVQQGLFMTAYLSKLNAVSSNRTDEFRKSLGFSIEQMLISCQIAGAECKPSDFVWYYDLLYGNCFKFNSGKDANGSSVPLKTTTKSGLTNGLILELFAGFDGYYTGLDYTSGIHVYINDQNDQYQLFRGLEVEKAKANNVAISKTTIQQLQSPYSDCENDFSKYDNELFKTVNNFYQKYTRTACFMMCYQKNVSASCGCYDPNAPPLSKDVRQCITFNDIFCDFQKYSQFYTKENIEENCVPYCPLECDKITFDYTITHSTYPTDKYVSRIMTNPVISSKFKPEDLTLENVKKSIVLLNIYYPAIEYTEIEESEKMGLFDLISGVGGVLGLFMGLSFLSLAEFFEIVFEWIFILFESNKKSSSKVKNFQP